MVRPMKRSTTFRKIKVRTPSGSVVRHYVKRKIDKRTCKNCGKVLSGMVHATEANQRKYTKTMRQPQRPYAGLLCSRCMRQEITNRAVEMVMKDG